MTNKKFKLAAMSLALTACVAASPLAANAESADAEVNKPASTTATSTDEAKPDTTNENDQKATDNNVQDAANNNEQNAADVNGVPAAAKAPVLMLAKAPAAPTGAPTAPAEENTAAEDVATINGKGYKSFDAAVEAAESGDTIEVIKDATSTGIDLQNKNLTIKGKTVTTVLRKTSLS